MSNEAGEREFFKDDGDLTKPTSEQVTDETPDPFQVAIWAKKAKAWDEFVKWMQHQDQEYIRLDYPEIMTELEGER